ncbi:MAG: Gfo/Idh/MocA family oxidoreductase [Planctomycetota bacterium]
MTRRGFLGGAAATTFGFLAVPSRVLGREGQQPPSDKLQVACIGCGGKGGGDVRGVSGEQVIALCDVDWNRARGSIKRHPKARKFHDYRVMLDEMDKDIDAVTVSTPDHHHAPASMRAMKRGKHVFCQKPLTHDIREARLVAETARETGVVTQMGIQGHAFEGPRLVKEWVEAGWLGPVREVWYWTNRPIWPQNVARPDTKDRVPESLDWNLWLGPASERPYVNKVYHPFRWRGWWDFGSGALGDIACHAMDAAYWALELGYPTAIEAEAGPMTGESPPNWSRITIEFPARGDKPPVKVVWNDGYGKKERPDRLNVPRPEDLEADRTLPGIPKGHKGRFHIGGQLIIGDEATIMAGVYCRSPRVIPEATMRDLLKNHKVPKTIPRSPGHMPEWIQACKANKPHDAKANFADYAGPLTEMVLIGNMAVRTGKRVEWDAEKMRSTNVPEANQYVGRTYRKGWEV